MCRQHNSFPWAWYSGAAFVTRGCALISVQMPRRKLRHREHFTSLCFLLKELPATTHKRVGLGLGKVVVFCSFEPISLHTRSRDFSAYKEVMCGFQRGEHVPFEMAQCGKIWVVCEIRMPTPDERKWKCMNIRFYGGSHGRNKNPKGSPSFSNFANIIGVLVTGCGQNYLSLLLFQTK